MRIEDDGVNKNASSSDGEHPPTMGAAMVTLQITSLLDGARCRCVVRAHPWSRQWPCRRRRCISYYYVNDECKWQRIHRWQQPYPQLPGTKPDDFFETFQWERVTPTRPRVHATAAVPTLRRASLCNQAAFVSVRALENTNRCNAQLARVGLRVDGSDVAGSFRDGYLLVRLLEVACDCAVSAVCGRAAGQRPSNLAEIVEMCDLAADFLRELGVPGVDVLHGACACSG